MKVENKSMRYQRYIFLTLINILNCNSLEIGICSSSGICLPSNYSKQSLPIENQMNYVNLEFLKFKILGIRDRECTLTIQLAMNVSWNDPRLIIKNSNDAHMEKMLEDSFLELMWKPDLYIEDLKHSRVPAIIHPYQGASVIGQEIALYGILEVTVYCPMRFDNFPLDSHTCYLKVKQFLKYLLITSGKNQFH